MCLGKGGTSSGPVRLQEVYERKLSQYDLEFGWYCVVGSEYLVLTSMHHRVFLRFV